MMFESSIVAHCCSVCRAAFRRAADGAMRIAERKRGMSVLVSGLRINHRHTRTGFANARPSWEWRKRKRRASVLVRGLRINNGRTRTALTNVRADTGFIERKRGMSVSVRGSDPFVFCDDSIPGKLFAVEVYDISNRQSRCLEVVHELRFVLRQNRLDGLEFENDSVAADEVGDVLLLKRLAAKVYRQRMLAFERYAGVAKRAGKGLLIDWFEKTGTEFVEYFHADSENLVGCFSICKHLLFPLRDGFSFNHGLSRTGLANARPSWERRKRKRRASVLVCGLERGAGVHELGKVCMDDAVALLDGIVAREDVLGVVVANLLKRGVFAVFGLAVVHHRHARLHVGVASIALAEYEVAFKRSDTPYACRIAVGTGVGVDYVFKRRPVVDPVVGIGGEVEAEVGQVVFLLTSDGSAGFEVEPAAFIQDLCVLQNADVAVQCFALDVRSRLFKIIKEVVETCRRAEVVDKVCLNFLEHGKIADLYAAADVFFEYLGNDAFNVCPAVVGGIVLNSLREAAVMKILVELIDKIGGYALSEKFLHAKELVEGEREHFEFNVSSRQLSDKLSAQEIGIRTGDEDGVSAFDAESIDYFFEVLYILDFIDEEICRSRGWCLFVDDAFKLVGGCDVFVWAAVKINIDNVRIVRSSLPHLFGNCAHKAGLTTTSDAGNDLYESRVLIKSANLAEVVLSLVVVHGGQYSKSAAKWQVKGVKYERLLKNTPLTHKFMSRWTCGCAFALVCGLENNHGLSRTGFANARPGLGFAERKRGMSVFVCGLNNHGLSRMGFANARPSWERRKRKRGMSVFVCGLNKTI